MEIKERNIAVCVILCFITLGIYAIYWFVVMTNDSNALAPKNATAPGGKAILLTIVTFGIYSIYWNYKLGNKVGEMNGGNDLGVPFLIMALFGLSIIGVCMAQMEINKHAGMIPSFDETQKGI